MPTLSEIIARPINSLSCFPDEAVTAISFISLLSPRTPLTSNSLLTLSLTVSAASKSLLKVKTFLLNYLCVLYFEIKSDIKLKFE